MTPLETLRDALTFLIDPWLFMFLALRQLPTTLAALLRARALSTILWPPSLSNALFGHFWAIAGPQVKQGAEPRVVPLLAGRVRGGEIHDEVVMPAVGGTLLEIGAGTGMWMEVLSSFAEGPVRRTRKSVAEARGVSRILGVEPHPQSAATLRRRVRELGLEGLYEVIPAGIETLLDDPNHADTALGPESVDCIVSVLCLCSIPDPEQNIAALYKLLRPGGRWYVYEHVKTERGGLAMSLYQRLVNLVWPWFLGSCRLCRPTGTYLRQAGPWTNIDLAQPPAEPAYHVLPHVWGTLTK